PNVGNVSFGGGINSETPYVRVQGSGDGTVDIYSFVVTKAMLNPTAHAPITSPSDSQQYYTSVSLRLSGAVREGDVWTLPNVRYQSYSYTVKSTDTTLEQIAQGLLDLLPGRFYKSTVGANGTLTIVDDAG